MLRRLPKHLLSAVRAPPSPLPAAASLHRLLLSTATATASPAPFVVEDYLVTTCGLTPAQALRSSKHLAQVKAPSNADAVLAFLADAGLAKSDVAAAIARDPSLLRCQVDKTLSPRIGKLRDIGLSPDQISRLIAIIPIIIRSPSMFPRLEFYISLLGSYEKAHTAIKRDRYILSRDLECLVKPNLSYLRDCGLTECDIGKIFSLAPRMVTMEPEYIREIVACADGLGVSRNSGMFKYALISVAFIGPERIKARRDLLKKALGCSEDELSIAVRVLPNVLNFSVGRMSRTVEFLKTEVGLKVEYIVRRPALLGYSFEKRLKPRHHVLKVLKSKGLLEKGADFSYAVGITNERFAEKYIDPYKEIVPGLADAAALCRT